MKQERDPHKEFQKAFSKNHAGYVLITCDQPAEDGEMKVEMTYGGSPSLAHMLIDGAQDILGDAVEVEAHAANHPCSNSKIASLADHSQ